MVSRHSYVAAVAALVLSAGAALAQGSGAAGDIGGAGVKSASPVTVKSGSPVTTAERVTIGIAPDAVRKSEKNKSSKSKKM